MTFYNYYSIFFKVAANWVEINKDKNYKENDKAKKNIIIFYHYFISCGDETPNKSNPDLIVR